MELITKLGIDWKSLLAQIVNFLILLFVLYRFAFKPLIALLDERSKKIEQGLENAEKIQKNLVESEKIREEFILKARHVAQDIIETTKREGEALRQNMRKETEAHVAKMVADGREQIARDREAMQKDLQGEMGDLIVEATRKVLAGTVNDKVNREYVNKILQR